MRLDIQKKEVPLQSSSSGGLTTKGETLTRSIARTAPSKDKQLDHKINTIYQSVSEVIVKHKDNFFRDVFATLPPFFLEHVYAKDKKYFARYFLKPALNIEDGKFEVVKIKPEILKTNIREIPAGYIIKRNIERAMLNVKEYSVYLEKSRTLFKDFLAAFASEHDENKRYFRFVERIEALVAALIAKQQLYLEKQVRAYLESSGFQKFLYPSTNRENKCLYYKPIYLAPRTIFTSQIEKIGNLYERENGQPSHYEVVIVNYDYLIRKDMFKQEKAHEQPEISELVYLSRINTYPEVKELEKSLSFLQNRKYRDEKKKADAEKRKQRLIPTWLRVGGGCFLVFLLLWALAYYGNSPPTAEFIRREGTAGASSLVSFLVQGYSRLQEGLMQLFPVPRVGEWQRTVNFLHELWIAALCGLIPVVCGGLLLSGIRMLFKAVFFLVHRIRFVCIKRSFRNYEQRGINGFFNMHNALKFITEFNRKHKDIDELIKKS